jgi:hypothetical protein
VKYWLHPEAADEHKKQVAHYEEIQAGLGRRYHTEFQNIVATVCASPTRSRIVLAPDIRRAMFKVFHFDIVYREVVLRAPFAPKPGHMAQSPPLGKRS